jgi:integrase
MAKLIKRNGIYYADLRSEGLGRVSLRTRDRQVATVRARKLELAETDPARHSTHTLQEALEWLINTAMAGRPSGTIHSYSHKARRLLGGLGGEALVSELTRDDLLRYVGARLDGDAAAATVYKEMVVLRRALVEARNRGLWQGDLTALVPRVPGASRPRDRWLTVAEYQDLLAQLQPHRQLWVVVAVQTGARVSGVEGTPEHPGLLWSNVDLERGWVRLPEEKTPGSWRRVPVSAELRRWLEAVPKKARRGLVAEPWQNYRRDLRAACARVGRAERKALIKAGVTVAAAELAAPPLDPVSGNDLRRTFASWLLQAGVNLLTVARLMGHGSTRMVERIYGQLSLDTYQDAVASMPGGDCAVFVPDAEAFGGTDEAHGTESKSKSAGIPALSVPRDRIELPTRGFSVPVLRAISGGKSNG